MKRVWMLWSYALESFMMFGLIRMSRGSACTGTQDGLVIHRLNVSCVRPMSTVMGTWGHRNIKSVPTQRKSGTIGPANYLHTCRTSKKMNPIGTHHLSQWCIHVVLQRCMDFVTIRTTAEDIPSGCVVFVTLRGLGRTLAALRMTSTSQAMSTSNSPRTCGQTRRLCDASSGTI